MFSNVAALALHLIISMAASNQVEVIVVGAGTSGISAARYLQDNTNYKVVIVEANDRTGGRINTVYHEGKPIELGAMWIHGGESRDQVVAEFCRNHSIGLKQFDFRTLNHTYMESNETVDENLVDRRSASLDLFLTKARVKYEKNDEDANLIDALQEASPKYYNSIKDNNITNYFNWPFIEETYGDSRTKISILEFDGEDDDDLDVVIPTGYQAFLDMLIQGSDSQSKSLKISLSSEVESIKKLEDKVHLQLKTQQTLAADAVVVSVSLGVLKADKISFEPPLSPGQKQAIQKIGFGNFGKVVMIFDRIFWPESIEWFVVKSDPPGFPLYFINLKKLHDIDGLIAVITGPNAFETDHYEDDHVMDKMRTSLRETFGDGVDSAKLISFNRTKWSADPLYLGAYSYGAVGMTEIDKINVRKSSYDRVFFAGEHTMWSENTYATVDVAYQSGIRAAKELIEAMSKPSTPSTTTSPSTTSTSRGSNCFHPLDLLSVLSTLFISAVLLL